MSGHSKWSKVKHQKAVTDVVKGAAFTKASRAISVAVAEGGGVTDPNHNVRLRLAIEAARAVNMPNMTIDRAIERGKTADETRLEHVLYEGYGPGGVAVLIDATTDNNTRTVALIKQILTHYNGSIASPGAVQFLFVPKGVITLKKQGVSEDNLLALAVEAGASDVSQKDDVYEVYTEPVNRESVRRKLSELGLTVDNSIHVWQATTTVTLTDNHARSLAHLKTELHALDDVQRVYDNAA
jgi:YebC/PmpR family DNA-binding regulatory protein